ncbi:MAG: SPFH domain-containing protein [Patescibacteria group bacterium]
MNAILIGTASTIAITAAVYSIGMPILLTNMAKQDFLVTTIGEGSGKVIVANGALRDIKMVRKGFHLNRPGKPGYDPSKRNYENLPDIPGVNYDERSNLFQEHNLHWVGLPWQHQIYTYKFAWSELKKNANGTQEIVTREAETDIFIANDFHYGMVLEELRTFDNVPTKIEVVITVWINNPERALFATNDWLNIVHTLVESVSKDYVGALTFDQIRSEKDEDGTPSDRLKQEYSLIVTALTETIEDRPDRKGMAEVYGVTIKSANLRKIIVTGETATELTKASTAKYTAETNAAAQQVKTDADAYTTRTIADADAYATLEEGKSKAAADKARFTVISENMEAARLLLGTEALKTPGQGKVIIADSDLVSAALKAAITKVGA